MGRPLPLIADDDLDRPRGKRTRRGGPCSDRTRAASVAPPSSRTVLEPVRELAENGDAALDGVVPGEAGADAQAVREPGLRAEDRAGGDADLPLQGAGVEGERVLAGRHLNPEHVPAA